MFWASETLLRINEGGDNNNPSSELFEDLILYAYFFCYFEVMLEKDNINL